MLASLFSQPEVFATSWVEALTSLALVSLAGGAYRHIECQQPGCHRLGRFRHEHRRLCGHHHPLER